MELASVSAAWECRLRCSAPFHRSGPHALARSGCRGGALGSGGRQCFGAVERGSRARSRLRTVSPSGGLGCRRGRRSASALSLPQRGDVEASSEARASPVVGVGTVRAGRADPLRWRRGARECHAVDATRKPSGRCRAVTQLVSEEALGSSRERVQALSQVLATCRRQSQAHGALRRVAVVRGLTTLRCGVPRAVDELRLVGIGHFGTERVVTA